MHKSIRFYDVLWKLQGITSLIAVLAFLFIDLIFIRALEKSGNLNFALNYFMAQHWLGYLMLLVILIGSFWKWRISIIVNIFYLYFTITSIIGTIEFSSGNAHFQYLTLLSNISLIMLIIMHICGFILLTSLLIRKYRK